MPPARANAPASSDGNARVGANGGSNRGANRGANRGDRIPNWSWAARPGLTAAVGWPGVLLAAFDGTGADAADRPGRLDERVLLAHQDQLRRLVHRLLGWPRSGVDVDDLVQDVLLSAWGHRRGFRGDSNVATWLYRIALRRVQRHARWCRVRSRLLGLLGDEPVERSDQGGDATVDHGALQRALARLAHADREVLVLRYLEDREVPAIAALLGCSRAAVDQRLSRARQRLRPHLVRLGLEATP